jgi:hypothetical protein
MVGVEVTRFGIYWWWWRLSALFQGFKEKENEDG